MAAAQLRVVRDYRNWGLLAFLVFVLVNGALESEVIAQKTGASADAHKIYEQKCMRCHTMHAADLARQKLKYSEAGNLQVARTSTALAPILKGHQGVELSDIERAALFELFEKGLARQGAFQHRCAVCHGRASDFSREKLTLTNGGLTTRGSGIDVRSFLKRHHVATPEDIDHIIEALTEHLQTAP